MDQRTVWITVNLAWIILFAASLSSSNIKDPRYIGCYELDDLEGWRNVNNEIMAPMDIENCAAKCAGRHFNVSGMMNGTQCWCGNECLYGRQTCDCCDVPCAGNTSLTCGGRNALDVYEAECRELDKWGPSCEMFCNCKHRATCNIYTGECPEDCLAGWEGCSCNQSCQDGYFGENCRNICVQCAGFACDRFTGHCNHSCADGYRQFPFCNESCINGTFGRNCSLPCNCLNDELCNEKNGSCPSGICKPGYDALVDLSCQTECQNGLFGENCTFSCKCNTTSDCYKVSGSCEDNLCQPGFTGPLDDPACQTECEEGTFGVNCMHQCHCLNTTSCNKTMGLCSDGLCAPGYNSSDGTCQSFCEKGTYGFNCSYKCNCFEDEVCYQENGTCPSATCQPGFSFENDPSCQTVNCTQTCNCFNSTCDQKSGFCQNGLCAPGYNNSDRTCQTECEHGTYGLGCMEMCQCFQDQYCDRLTGNCEESSDPRSKFWITFGMSAVVALFLLIFLVLVIRRNCAKNTKALNDAESSPNCIINLVDLSHSKTLIRLEDLETVVLAQKKLKEPFKEDYESLSPGNTEGQDGNLPGNKSKNRYKDIVPYDTSRVRLNVIHDDPLSDYINASYIDGFSVDKKFIASQAPTQRTLEDFWRMLWEQDVGVVVMLTGLVEGEKVKCTKYWSDKGKRMTTGEREIETLSENVFKDYVERKFEVTWGNETKRLTQLHFTAWKDYKVPDSGDTLLRFCHKIRETAALSQKTTPILVHCSAGVGRTGTLIALDSLLEQAEEEGRIDIFRCVEKMRTARTNMVNTRLQYEYLYETMLEWYILGCTAVETSDFPRMFKDTDKIQEQFQLLKKFRSIDVEYCEDLKGSLEENIMKNRDKNILPLACSRVSLMTNSETDGDYINAVFVDGYQMKNTFVVTQLPLPDTRADLWRMLWDYPMNVVIVFLHEAEAPYWPETGVKTTEGIFSLETQFHTKLADRITAYNIEMKFQDKTKCIRILSLSGFSVTKKDITILLKVHNIVKEWTNTRHCNMTVIQCTYGVEMCGIFIAVSNLLKMINTEREVDVFQCVKKMRGQRPEFIQNLEEYQYLYIVIYHYLHNDNNLYMNLI